MNNTLKVILTTITSSALAMFIMIKIVASNLSLMPVAVSYFAVIILVALAALDYRVGSKHYAAR